MSSRRTPFDEMNRMLDQMRRSMMDIGSMMDPNAADETLSMDATDQGANLSLERTDDGFVALADLPGFEREEIDLRFRDGSLLLSATHESADDADDRMLRRRRSVSERVRVPGSVDRDGIEASYRNGVLEVHLPVEAEDVDGERIDIA
jgi:HSP20 family protein